MTETIPSQKNPNQLLVQAILDGDAGTARAALAQGADPNGEVEPGLPVVFKAISAAQPEILTELLKAGAGVSASNRDGYSPLHWAVGVWRPAQSASACIETLLDHGADLNAVMGEEQEKPIHLAEYPSLINLLAERGADLDARDGLGRTSLMRQCQNLITFRAFIDHMQDPASLKLRDHAGNTVCHHAVMNGGNLDVVRILVDLKADFEAENVRGETPLALAKGECRHTLMAERDRNSLDSFLDSLFEQKEATPEPASPPPAPMAPRIEGQFEVDFLVNYPGYRSLADIYGEGVDPTGWDKMPEPDGQENRAAPETAEDIFDPDLKNDSNDGMVIPR